MSRVAQHADHAPIVDDHHVPEAALLHQLVGQHQLIVRAERADLPRHHVGHAQARVEGENAPRLGGPGRSSGLRRGRRLAGEPRARLVQRFVEVPA